MEGLQAGEWQALVAQVGAAKSSFYAAMKLLPPEKRDAMFAIYAFCRAVDDIADEPGTQAEKQAGLAQWRVEIETIYAGGPAPTLLGRALAVAVRQFDLQQRDFMAVIEGMAMDAERDIRAPSAVELDLYCDRVASAVGRLGVRVFGAWRPASDEVAHHLGRALQLTNILRDLDEDAERGRLYLPREGLVAAGIMSDDPAIVLAHPGLGAACAGVVVTAQAHFVQADRAMSLCPKTDMRAPRLMGAVYGEILQHLKRRGWAAPRAEVRIPRAHKLWLALRTYLFGR